MITPQGNVKWFSNQKAYGFITPEGGSRDVFVHFSAVKGNGFKSLNEGDAVAFKIIPGPNGKQTANIVRP